MSNLDVDAYNAQIRADLVGPHSRELSIPLGRRDWLFDDAYLDKLRFYRNA